MTKAAEHLRHDLNLSTYSLTDILGLFGIPASKMHELDLSDMKAAKQIAAMTHPDKSGLGDEYFRFYREAFGALSAFYRSQARQHVSREERLATKVYDSGGAGGGGGDSEVIRAMRAEEFNAKFQDLFETHVGAAEDAKRKRRSERDCWMSSGGGGAGGPAARVGSVDELHAAFHGMREPARAADTTSLSVASGEFQSSLFRSGTHDLYAEEDEDEEAEGGGEKSYVSSDVFNAKLKFDDLRRVHRDHSIFDVSDAALNVQMLPVASLDETRRRRAADAVGHQSAQMESAAAEGVLRDRERAFRERMVHGGYADNLRTSRYEEMNKQVLGAFLQIANY